MYGAAGVGEEKAVGLDRGEAESEGAVDDGVDAIDAAIDEDA